MSKRFWRINATLGDRKVILRTVTDDRLVQRDAAAGAASFRKRARFLKGVDAFEDENESESDHEKHRTLAAGVLWAHALGKRVYRELDAHPVEEGSEPVGECAACYTPAGQGYTVAVWEQAA